MQKSLFIHDQQAGFPNEHSTAQALINFIYLMKGGTDTSKIVYGTKNEHLKTLINKLF